MRSVLTEELTTMDDAARLRDDNAHDEWDANAHRRPELLKHKTMKTIDELVAHHKAIENRVPNRPLGADLSHTTPHTGSAAVAAPSSSSKSSTKAFQLLRDYEMATSILESRNRADFPRRRPHVSFEQQKIRMDKAFRTAPGGTKIVLDSPPSSDPDNTVRRVLRSASTAMLSKDANIASSSSGNDDSSSSLDNDSGNKKKKTVSFQDEASFAAALSAMDPRTSLSSSSRRQHHMDHARCQDDENGKGNGHVTSPIHAACYKGDHLLVTHLLNSYCGQEAIKLVNSHCSCGMTPLQVACDQGHVKVAKVLVRRQARINKRTSQQQQQHHHQHNGSNTSPVGPPAGFSSISVGKKRHRSCLALACACRSAELVAYLLDEGAAVDEDVLVTACSVGDLPIVRLLMAQSQKKNRSAPSTGGITGGLEKLWGGSSSSSSSSGRFSGSSSSGTTNNKATSQIEATWISNASAIAVVNDHPQMLSILLGDAQTPASRDRVVSCALEATMVADYKLLRCLTKLFDHKLLTSAKDTHGNSLLHLAVKQASGKCVTLLIRLGVDVNARDALGITPLFMACARGQSSIVRLLVNAGAACECMGPNDETPLHIAAQENHLNCVQILLDESHAPVDVTTLDKCTALHLACQRGNTLVAKSLLDHGADINAKTVCDETPLLKASRMSNMETVKLLLSRNAEIATSSTSSISSCASSSRREQLEMGEYTYTASTSSSVFSTTNSLRDGHDQVESEEEVIFMSNRRHYQQRRQRSTNGAAHPRSSRGDDGVVIAKSNTHTSIKGWLKSVVGKK